MAGVSVDPWQRSSLLSPGRQPAHLVRLAVDERLRGVDALAAQDVVAHGGFDEHRAGALGFVSHLAGQRGLKTRDVGTYRFFYDPTEEDATARTMRFWVIGIPGSVVVVSILCDGETPVSPLLSEVRDEIPQIVGELL